MIDWEEPAKIVYYAGAGVTFFVTSFRFMFRYVQNIGREKSFMKELQDDMPKVKRALRLIGSKLDIDMSDLD